MSTELAPPECVLDHGSGPLDLRELFPAPAPLEVDLGCGDGSFLCALAEAHPDRNFLGVERLRGRVRSARHKITARRLTNACILQGDIAESVTSLPHQSVHVCHIMFPDPWPKRRHHRRRTVTTDLLQAISRTLVPEGMLRLTTDDPPYFQQMRKAAAAVPELVTVTNDDEMTLPQSTFEKRFVAAGMPVHRLSLRKTSPET